MILSLYRTIVTLLEPLIIWHLKRRQVHGKEDAERFRERLGIASRERPPGSLIWMHAASVGEALSLLPLIERILQHLLNVHILMTTGTVTSANLMAKRLPDGAFHQFVPVDQRLWVTRFLNHWQPNLVLWAESDLWPNLVTLPSERNIPMILVNGRMSARSHQHWRSKALKMAQRLLVSFDFCLMQTPEDAERFMALGAKKAEGIGNLKYAAAPLPVNSEELAELKNDLIGRPVWMAASTHSREEILCARAHEVLTDRHPGLLTIITPRHPDRGIKIAKQLRRKGLNVVLRSAKEPLHSGTDIYLVDTMGELGLFFRIAPIVFMGKSLAPLGGQNLLEPARLNSAILHGPHMMNFTAIANEFNAAQAALMVTDENNLIETLDRLMNDPQETMRLSSTARTLAESKTRILDSVMERLAPYLETL